MPVFTKLVAQNCVREVTRDLIHGFQQPVKRISNWVFTGWDDPAWISEVLFELPPAECFLDGKRIAERSRSFFVVFVIPFFNIDSSASPAIVSLAVP